VVWVDGTGRTWVFVATGTALAAYDLTLDASHIPQLTQRWSVATGATSPILANGVLYVAGSGSIRAYNPIIGGAPLWSGSIGTTHWQSPVVFDGLVLMEDSAGHLTAWGL
jgi:hypothetical protein